MSLGRNEPCHCGSGKKYKKCCLPKDKEPRHEKEAELAETRQVQGEQNVNSLFREPSVNQPAGGEIVLFREPQRAQEWVAPRVQSQDEIDPAGNGRQLN